MPRMTPEQEAAYALDFDLDRGGLRADVRQAHDRLAEQRSAMGEDSATHSSASEVVEFRRRGFTITVVLMCVFWGALFLAMTLSSGVWWEARVPAGLACAGLVVLAWRAGGLAITAGPDEIVIRNVRNTHHIPWSQIEDILETPPIPAAVYRENPLATQEYSLLVRLKEGAVISASLYRTEGQYGYRRKAREQAVAQLRELWRERSGAAAA